MVEHYFSKKPEVKIKLTKVNLFLRGVDIDIYFSSGVFSSHNLDFGTKVLIENMLIKEKDDVLDLGCGNGAVGIIAAHLTKGKVYLTDINERACEIAEKNSKKLSNIKVLCGNMYETVKNKKFNIILLNPPQTAGKKVCFEMIEKAKNYLKKNGSLQLVARHNKGGKGLSEKMKEVFGNLDTLVKQGGFRVYISKLK
ncbi:MAG: methyltransferase [Nanoarchaeota archaeon]|nr:methyltransferase [Nanoarchaeota archaeon]MBU4352523.1 methyltransferase [Nanoarchaeota archaeon]MBU4456272.1 methyltransferase [Nanoarchaeota archaeon]MCG2720267.1 methyltransferase [Nanoarchaeota archaeon]